VLPKGIKAKIISAIKKSPEGIYYKLQWKEKQTVKRLLSLFDFFLFQWPAELYQSLMKKEKNPLRPFIHSHSLLVSPPPSLSQREDFFFNF
jgi:hypothetical protein